jgi:hypothetical protein
MGSSFKCIGDRHSKVEGEAREYLNINHHTYNSFVVSNICI